MLMDILGIILAFSTLMMLFGLLVTTVVQFMQNLGAWREKILSDCLEQFSLHLDSQVNNGVKMLKSSARELLQPVSLNSSNNTFFGKKYLHTNINKQQIQQFFENSIDSLSDTIISDKQQRIEQHKVLLEQKFEQFEQEMTTLFTRKTHFWSFVIAVFITLAFQINTFDLFTRLSMDKAFREQLIQIAELSVENEASPCRELNTVATFKQKSRQVIQNIEKSYVGKPAFTNVQRIASKHYDDLISIKSEVKLVFTAEPTQGAVLLQQINSGIDELNQQHKQWLEYCVQSNGKNLSALGFELLPYGFKYYGQGGPSMLGQHWLKAFFHTWFGMLVSAILISLGGPFWFDRIKDLVKLKENIPVRK